MSPESLYMLMVQSIPKSHSKPSKIFLVNLDVTLNPQDLWAKKDCRKKRTSVFKIEFDFQLT